MAPNAPSQSRLLAVRGLFTTPARRALHYLLERLPVPAQKLGASAVQAAAARWPMLSRLLGMAPPTTAAAGDVPVGQSARGDAPAKAAAAMPIGAPATPARAASGEAPPSPPANASGREQHLARLRNGGDYGDRARAALALATITDPEATAALVTALRDQSSEVAAQAAEALAQHRGDVATSALRGVLENREGYFSSEARASAVRSLGTLLPAGEGAPIAGALGDVDALVSLAAIATLAERDESLSAGALMGVLEDRRGFYLPLTRHAAARALGRLHHYDRDRLRGLLSAEYDDVVRETLSSMAN